MRGSYPETLVSQSQVALTVCEADIENAITAENLALSSEHIMTNFDLDDLRATVIEIARKSHNERATRVKAMLGAGYLPKLEQILSMADAHEERHNRKLQELRARISKAVDTREKMAQEYRKGRGRDEVGEVDQPDGAGDGGDVAEDEFRRGMEERIKRRTKLTRDMTEVMRLVDLNATGAAPAPAAEAAEASDLEFSDVASDRSSVYEEQDDEEGGEDAAMSEDDEPFVDV